MEKALNRVNEDGKEIYEDEDGELFVYLDGERDYDPELQWDIVAPNFAGWGDTYQAIICKECGSRWFYHADVLLDEPYQYNFEGRIYTCICCGTKTGMYVHVYEENRDGRARHWKTNELLKREAESLENYYQKNPKCRPSMRP